MNTNRKFPWWVIVLIVLFVCILCIGCLAVAGYAIFALRQPTVFPDSGVLPTPAEFLIPTVDPGVPQSGGSGPSLTGSQQSSDVYFFDDFSSEALGWPVFDDGKTIIKYEDGQYSFQVTEPDYYDWAYVPVDFAATDIWFDVVEKAGSEDGTFGVFCRFQDEANYYFVEFDLAEGWYMIGQYVDDEFIALTPQDAEGSPWQETSALKPLGEVNRIGISCYADYIILYINDEWVTEVSVSSPFSQSGEMALFVFAYSFAGSEGYKVYFDHVEVYKPVQ